MNAISIFKLIFIDGQLIPEQSNLPENILLITTNDIELRLPKNTILENPIHLKFLSSGKQNIHNQFQHKIILEENSQMTLFAEYAGDFAENYQTITTVECVLEKNAVMHYYKLQAENAAAIHHSVITIEQQESSQTKIFFADCGAAQAQVNLQIKLNERYANCSLHGLYRLNNDNQQINNHIHVDHIAEHGESAMHFKGILDKKSRAEFLGKVHVHEQAQHTNAKQSNHNLLLSKHAEVNAKPQLEIYADDVKCTHGATVGQLEEDALFYLRSRGIEKDAAYQMLTAAFANDVMNQISHPAIRDYLQERMSQYETV